MQSHPLPALSLDQAILKQFALVDAISRVFRDVDFLTQGDLGLLPNRNQPITTEQVEAALSLFFSSESTVLVRGAGTGAIREALFAGFSCGASLLIHDAPLYPTTRVIVEKMGLKLVTCDYNSSEKLKECLHTQNFDGILVQHARQTLEDSYELPELLQQMYSACPKELPIICDDNYAVMKVPYIGCELGASVSCFSLFKLLGPPGVGCVTGMASVVETIRGSLYSGGSKIQGFEALDALRSLIYAPVLLAIQAQVCEDLCQQLNDGALLRVRRALVANAQSRVVLVEFTEPIAQSILEIAQHCGVATRPVGAESRYECLPMFYRLSSSFRESNSDLATRMIRINPMRAGSKTILRLLSECLEQIH